MDFAATLRPSSACRSSCLPALNTVAVALVANGTQPPPPCLNRQRHLRQPGQQHLQPLPLVLLPSSQLLFVALDGTRQASAVDPAPLTADFGFAPRARHTSSIHSTTLATQNAYQDEVGDHGYCRYAVKTNPQQHLPVWASPAR